MDESRLNIVGEASRTYQFSDRTYEYPKEVQYYTETEFSTGLIETNLFKIEPDYTQPGKNVLCMYVLGGMWLKIGEDSDVIKNSKFYKLID